MTDMLTAKVKFSGMIEEAVSRLFHPRARVVRPFPRSAWAGNRVMTRTYIIADVHGRFDLLIRAMEAISIDARERRRSSLPEHRIAILGNIEQGRDSEEIVEYLTQERLRRRAAPIILGGGPEYSFVSTDLNPDRLVIGIFNDDSVSDRPIDFIDIDTR